MDKTEKQKLLQQWLDTPACMQSKRTRETRSIRAIDEADKAVVRSSKARFERGEEASQIWLLIKDWEAMKEQNITFTMFREVYVNKRFPPEMQKLLRELID